MQLRRAAALFVLLVSCSFALAKDKKKVILSPDILQAHNVLVIVDPNAGVDAQDPVANGLARVNVEQALTKWGRLMPVTDGYTADLILVVRKGNGKFAQSTIGGTPINGTPPVSVGSTTTADQSTTRAAGRWGNSGLSGDPSNSGASTLPHPQIEVGESQDTLLVYRSSKGDPNSSPLDAPPLWRFTAKDALDSPSVPAVEAFRKAIAESEKQLASNP